MDMEDLNDLILGVVESIVDPSASLKEMEDLIANDNDCNSKKNEDISFGHMEPMPKFDDLEICITQDGESAKENETDVQ